MIKPYSDSTLMSLTKAELIERLRCAEHNQEVAEQRLEQHIENVKDWKPVKHGHWEYVSSHLLTVYNRCSICKNITSDFVINEQTYNHDNPYYCPKCGAEMSD